ncbi:MAG TPA: hypothetical protein VKW09_00205 [bacterium]|nr:hypothetical protein [bacterium]
MRADLDTGALRADAPVTVITATWLEAKAARRALRGARVVVAAGIGLRHLRAPVAGTAVTCGLAGALSTHLAPGAVVVPHRVLRPDGTWLACDPALVEALVAAARRLGFEPDQGAVATTAALVRGAARAEVAARGCVAVDMETGLLTAPRIATVRAILDTPAREISEVWLRHPLWALVRPAAWGEALWLWRQAPRCAGRAAAVLAEALGRRNTSAAR